MNPFVEIKNIRERAAAAEKAGRFEEAEAAYEALAKAWLMASGLAVSASEKRVRIEYAKEAKNKAIQCRSRKGTAVPAAGTDGPQAGERRTGERGGAVSGAEPDQAGAAESLEELLAELDSLVGLEGVKLQIDTRIAALNTRKEREKRGLKNPKMSLHLVFTGNPGTGKTTVARLVAKIYRAMGLLTTGQLVETDRSGLVAGYVGQTAQKTKEVIEKAIGGVLFIDEAYALAPGGDNGNDFGREAIETLLKEMEDKRDQLVVIAAGYTEEIKNFIDSNPGLKSRFKTTIDFENYTADDLTRIFKLIANKVDYEPTPECLDAVRQHYAKVLENPPKDFANARDVRNLFEKAIDNQARRLNANAQTSVEEMKRLTADDLGLS